MLCQLVILSDFFNIFFRRLIIKIDCEKIIEHMKKCEDGYRGYIQKIMLLQVIQHIICEMLIGRRKCFNSDVFFSVSNIRTNFQNDSSEFEGLLHEMVSKKPFIIRVICYINGNGKRKL